MVAAKKGTWGMFCGAAKNLAAYESAFANDLEAC